MIQRNGIWSFRILCMKKMRPSQSGSRLYSNNGNLTSITFENGVKTITMCDLKTRNALSLAMMENLRGHINADQMNPDLRVLIIAAKGPVFSAGHNLKELNPQNGREVQEKVFQAATKLMCSIIDAPVPVIAKVDGVAAAAGCQLVAQCDVAVCSERSTFSTPGANFGIFCSTPGVALARTIPKMIAMKMLLTGQPISSSEAKQCGLVAEIHPSECLDDAVEKLLNAIKAKSRSVIELGKRFYYKQIQVDVKKAYEFGGQQMVDNLQMSDGKEGVKSFIEKRKPTWTHKSL